MSSLGLWILLMCVFSPLCDFGLPALIEGNDEVSQAFDRNARSDGIALFILSMSFPFI